MRTSGDEASTLRTRPVTEADLILAWAKAFALTVTVELVVAVPALARTGRDGFDTVTTSDRGQGEFMQLGYAGHAGQSMSVTQ